MNKKLVGLKNTLNAVYQHNMHKIAKNILGNKKSITISNFMKNSIFSTLDENTKKNLQSKIVEIAGNEIDKNELKTILILLDANLESTTINGKKAEKFIMDSEFIITKNNGILQATKKEVKNLKEDVSVIYDYDNPNSTLFPSPGENAMYDKNDKFVRKMNSK